MGQIAPFASIIDLVQDSVDQFPFWPLPIAHALKKCGNCIPLGISQICGVRFTLIAHKVIYAISVPYENTFLDASALSLPLILLAFGVKLIYLECLLAISLRGGAPKSLLYSLVNCEQLS